MHRYDHVNETSCSNAVKQFVIAAGGVAISLVVPVVHPKGEKKLSEWRKVYAIIGIVSLALVIVIGSVSYGAKLGFQVAGINVQPSELVKIVFVFLWLPVLNSPWHLKISL